VLPNAGLNVYDILRATKLVLTQDAVDAIHERFKDKTGKAEAAPTKRAPAKTAAKAEGAAA
jgi:large subunit ribosomal protein L4